MIGLKAYKGFDENFSLTGKIAVITGGASGLGKAIAEMFTRKGAKVALLDMNEKVDAIAKEMSPDAMGIQMDIVNLEDIGRCIDVVLKQYGRIDILCNVAGLGDMVPAEDITVESWNRIVAVNLTGLFFMTQRVGREMIAAGNGGKIINMASQAAVIGLWGHACYGATKAGVLNITKVLANEWGKHGINVNAISPTITMTPMAAEFWVGERAENFLKELPIGRFGQPDEVAACALFLASGASDMITGENLVIDGGYTIR